MYILTNAEKVVRIPPTMLDEDFNEVVGQLTCESFEGRIEGDHLTVLISNVRPVGLGRVVHGDGAVYQQVAYDQLIFRPQLQEVIEGIVCEILKFGAFVRFGPLDGLLHISQIMDDRIHVDADNQRLVGKDNSRTLAVGDRVRARIVALSLNERNPRESKIGLTMRQPGLGKLEWLEEDRKAKGELQ
ncbi:MAG: DNA-directed polymerase subunit [Candidatus Methanomethylophilaceae archaeon]|nr:DNA-directed polymerase subunit [Candidatus Methanomethylophilaceae archaeon]MDI3541872.1 DNA-directed polymerase subunit [Candidatus Methanomethylophilaceae archaeon]HII99995.1 DNA-directed RNA polymerase [Candidatus Methanomethylophilaceae archaeon]